jgi:hypothetical protein
MRELSDMEASAAAWSSALLRHYCQARLADATDGLAVVFDHELRVRVAQGTTIAAAAGMVGRLMPDVMSTESWERVRGPYEAALTGTPDTRSSQRGRQRTRSLPVRCWPWTGCRRYQSKRSDVDRSPMVSALPPVTQALGGASVETAMAGVT